MVTPTLGSLRLSQRPLRQHSLLHLVLSALIVLRTKAQTTNATCVSNSTNSWLFNSAGESPCLVWSKIQSLCIPPTSFINVPPLLDTSYSYNAPTSQSSACQCNAVSYSLMAGCTYCQWGSGSIPNGQDWSSGCSTYNSQGLGFNETVLDIPEWAFHTWRNDTWDAAVAQTVTSSPSPTSYTTTLSRSFLPTAATPSPTLPTNQSSESSSSATSTATSSASASGSAPPATKWAPVVGGIAGAMVLFLIFGLSWRYYRSRRKHKLSDRSTRPRPDNENDATPTWLTAAGAGADTGAGTGAQEMVEEGVVNPYRFASLDDAASPEKETNTPKKKKKKKRIPYPYPTDANSADHTAPEEDDNTQERDRHRSFLDMDPDLEIGPSSRTRGNTRRTTEMIIDPEAFAAPRPAPKIPSKAARRRRSSVGRYTTTQERLREKRISLTSSDLASPPRALRQSMISGYDDKALGPGDTEMQVDIPSDPTSLASPRSIASEIGEDKSLPLNGAGTQYVVEDIQDFSQPQPPHSHDQYAQARNSDATLPSLYSPRTGAATWRRSTMIDSPGSRYYPITEYYDPDPLPGSDERGGEMIGAALGSGTKYRDSRWDGGNRQSGEWRDDGWDNVSDMPSTHRQNGR